MKTINRSLESIVPSVYKKDFGLYVEDAPPPPKFEFKDQQAKNNAGNEEPPAGYKSKTPQKEPSNDQSKWLMKKLVGTLKYAGAMATEVRGSHSDDANEINEVIEKIIDDLKAISTSLEKYVTEEQEEKPDKQEEPEEKDDEHGEAASDRGEEQADA